MHALQVTSQNFAAALHLRQRNLPGSVYAWLFFQARVIPVRCLMLLETFRRAVNLLPSGKGSDGALQGTSVVHIRATVQFSTGGVAEGEPCDRLRDWASCRQQQRCEQNTGCHV